MIFDFLLSALFGFGLHQTRRVTNDMPHGWQSLSEHGIGGVGLLVAWPYWYRRLHSVSNCFVRGWLSLAMSLLGIGAGVVCGWYWDER